MVHTKLRARKSTGGRAKIPAMTVTGSRMSVEQSPGVPKPKRCRFKCKTKFTQKKSKKSKGKNNNPSSEDGEEVEQEDRRNKKHVAIMPVAHKPMRTRTTVAGGRDFQG